MIDTVAILAGGLATRLRPITETIPKSMIQICGKPFIDHQLELLHDKGLKNVVLCVGFLGDQIKAHVEDGKKWGVKVNYSFDGEMLLGTGGALRQAIEYLPDKFFVLYGDSYLDINYAEVSEFYTNSKIEYAALMTVYKNDGKYDSSNVVFENNILVRYDKIKKTSDMRYIDYGLGILTKGILEEIPKDKKYDLAVVYMELLKQNRLLGYEVKERFYETGSVEGIKELEERLKNR